MAKPRKATTVEPRHCDSVRIVSGELEGEDALWDSEAHALDDYCYVRLDSDPAVRRLVRYSELEMI